MNIKLLDKIIAIFLYTMPLKVSIPFGYYLFYKKYLFLINILLFLTFPIDIIEKSLPFGGFLFYILIYLTIVKNNYMSNFLRFNATLALSIDLFLILISYCLRILPIVEIGSIIFLLNLFTFFYCIYMVVLGKLPQILFLSNLIQS